MIVISENDLVALLQVGTERAEHHALGGIAGIRHFGGFAAHEGRNLVAHRIAEIASEDKPVKVRGVGLESGQRIYFRLMNRSR